MLDDESSHLLAKGKASMMGITILSIWQSVQTGLMATVFACSVSCGSVDGVGTADSTGCIDEVIVNGLVLTPAQLKSIESTYGIRPRPGNYWYDKRSGLYGVVGYPAYGFMHPGHRFGILKRSASAGRSGVVVNGRELQQCEVRLLSSIWRYPVQPGYYWFDANGDTGIQGQSTPLGNLFRVARSHGFSADANASDNFWSTRFSAGNSDRGNTRGYVSVPGYGPVGYGF